jgi:WD40 repeat protein
VPPQAAVKAQAQQGQNPASPQAQVQARAVIVAAAPTPAETPKPPIPHESVATIPGAQRILSAAASPTAEEILVLAQISNDSYGGSFFLVRLDAAGNKTEGVEAVLEGTNAEYSDAPVWSPDGGAVYLTFDNGSFPTSGNDTGHGLFVLDHGSGKVTQILKDAIGGLTISPDGTLAGFWDYTAGNKLSAYDLQKKEVVRAWSDQVHSADDMVISDIAFAPDGKSLLARLYVPREVPTMQYEIASGKITPFAKNLQSMALVGDSLYFLQFEPVPFPNPEHAHRLMKWTSGGVEPAVAVADFRYTSLSAGPGSPWLVGGSNGGYADGVAVYDTRTGQLQTAGKSCSSAVVTARGKILYVFGNELVSDAAVCSGSPPRTADEE